MIRTTIKILDKIYGISFGFLNLGIIGLLFSILSSDIIKFGYKEIILKILIILIAIPLTISIIIKTFKLIFFYLKCFNNSMLGKKCEYTCLFLGEKGDMETQVYFQIKNISFSPQRVFLSDSEGFRDENDFCPKYSIVSRSQHLTNSEIRIIGANEKLLLSKYEDYSENINVYQAIWSTSIDPPLISGEEIELVRHSVDRSLEKTAFSANGTIFIFRCRTPYKLFTMNVVAPNGYIFSDIYYEIDNQNGKTVSLKGIINKFLLSGNKNIKWEIPYPNISLRYKIKFKLVSI